MGHPKFPLDLDLEDVQLDQLTDEDFVWNYTSPEFPMLQVSSLVFSDYIDVYKLLCQWIAVDA